MRHVQLLDGTEAPQFSHSQLGSAYTCQYRWKLQYGEGKFLPPSIQMKKGSYIHGYLESLYLYLMDPRNGYGGNPHRLSGDELLKAFNTVLVDGADFVIANESMALVKRYADRLPKLDRFLHYVTVEQHYLVPFVTPGGNRVALEGYIDLTAIDTRTGKVGNMDHKSSLSPWTAEQAKIDSQLTFYWLILLSVIDHHGNPAPFPVSGGWINNLVTYPYKNMDAATAEGKLFHRFPLRTNPEAVEEYGKEIGRFIDRLIEQDYYPKRWTKDCHRCPFVRVCEAELNGDKKTARLILDTQFMTKEMDSRPREESQVSKGLTIKVRRNSRTESPQPTPPTPAPTQAQANDWLSGSYDLK